MGFFSSIFGKPTLVDKVPPHIRQNAAVVGEWIRSSFPKKIKHGDFTFEYLYTHCEPIDQNGKYGAVVYICIESLVHEYVSNLPIGFPKLDTAINEHRARFNNLPSNISKGDTRFLYFNMGKVFRAC